jgi:putative flavoprotein involved in K+ transport
MSSSRTTVDTVVIGAGHAGLAVSRLLTGAGHDHVVLERGRVGERWRRESWDSLHLLTPSWMTRLPGWSYEGPAPDGYLAAGEFVEHLERYADSFGVPLIDGTTVEEVRVSGRGGGRYAVATDRGTWLTDNVVVATGPHGIAKVPAGLAREDVVSSTDYRNPDQLPDGGVLVVGASSSGVQIADELNRWGRDVVLAVGRHTRMPRRYRGLDIYWWMEMTGRMARTIEQMPDPVAARREPSMQLVGGNDPERSAPDLDLALLQSRGVRLTGRLASVSGRVARFRDDLRVNLLSSELSMRRFLNRVDGFVARAGLEAEVWPGTWPRPVQVVEPPTRLDLRAEGIGSIVVAAGFRPHHPWLRLPVIALDGSIRQRRGVTDAPGVYTVGQRFQHRRDSGLIDGARHDAQAVVDHLLGQDASCRRTQGSLA